MFFESCIIQIFKSVSSHLKNLEAEYLMNSFLLTTNLLITPEMTPVGKPYPDPLLKACDLLNVTPSEALYVGDMSSDCDSASAANIDFCWADWGYGKHSKHHIILDSPLDLLDYLGLG